MSSQCFAPRTPPSVDRTLRLGSSGRDVREWQLFLNIAVDGRFGPITELATATWQADHGLDPDGTVNLETRTAAGCVMPPWPVRPYKPQRHIEIDTLVLGATSRPAPLSGLTWPRQTSECLHYWVTPETQLHHLGPADPAFFGAGIHARMVAVDLATHTRKNRADWLDPDSQDLLLESARIAAQYCRDYHIPAHYCDEVDLRRGRPGITTQAAIARAFNRPPPELDFGFFPINDFLPMTKWADRHFTHRPSRLTLLLADLLDIPPETAYRSTGMLQG